MVRKSMGPGTRGGGSPGADTKGPPQKREICLALHLAPGLGQLQKSQQPAGATAREAAAPTTSSEDPQAPLRPSWPHGQGPALRGARTWLLSTAWRPF